MFHTRYFWNAFGTHFLCHPSSQRKRSTRVCAAFAEAPGDTHEDRFWKENARDVLSKKTPVSALGDNIWYTRGFQEYWEDQIPGTTGSLRLFFSYMTVLEKLGLSASACLRLFLEADDLFFASPTRNDLYLFIATEIDLPAIELQNGTLANPSAFRLNYLSTKHVPKKENEMPLQGESIQVAEWMVGCILQKAKDLLNTLHCVELPEESLVVLEKSAHATLQYYMEQLQDKPELYEEMVARAYQDQPPADALDVYSATDYILRQGFLSNAEQSWYPEMDTRAPLGVYKLGSKIWGRFILSFFLVSRDGKTFLLPTLEGYIKTTSTLERWLVSRVIRKDLAGKANPFSPYLMKRQEESIVKALHSLPEKGWSGPLQKIMLDAAQKSGGFFMEWLGRTLHNAPRAVRYAGGFIRLDTHEHAMREHGKQDPIYLEMPNSPPVNLRTVLHARDAGQAPYFSLGTPHKTKLLSEAAFAAALHEFCRRYDFFDPVKMAQIRAWAVTQQIHTANAVLTAYPTEFDFRDAQKQSHDMLDSYNNLPETP